jgi:hypothetical protein
MKGTNLPNPKKEDLWAESEKVVFVLRRFCRTLALQIIDKIGAQNEGKF